MNLGKNQLDELISVFRAESMEHVKSLAEMLFSLEDGEGDVEGLLKRGFRDAHSLKGSAGTIGFDRVAEVAHRFEDMLGVIGRDHGLVDSAVIDLLLTTLDVIRLGVGGSTPGDAELNEEERQAIAAITAFIEQHEGDGGAELEPASAEEDDESAASSGVDASRARASLAPPPSVEAGEGRSSSTKGGSDEQGPDASRGKGRGVALGKSDEFVRISQSNIETVIGQVGELFEASLQVRAVGPELQDVHRMAGDLAGAFEMYLSGTDENVSAEGQALMERARGFFYQLGEISKRFDESERVLFKLVQNSQEGLRKIRLAPVSTVFVMIRRQVREISKLTGKKVELFLKGGEYEIDRKVLDAIEDPLVHILRNAVDHGIETPDQRRAVGKSESGRLSVVARHTGDAVELSVADDGRGIDVEDIRGILQSKYGRSAEEVSSYTADQLLDFLFQSGFSTQHGVSKISGRGVGLDVVKYAVERVGGEVRLDSQPGEGSVTSLRLPLAMSTLRCLLVRVSGKVMAVPAANVEKVILQSSSESNQLGGGEVIVYRDQNIPLGSLADLLQLSAPSQVVRDDTSLLVVIIHFGQRRFAFIVDSLVEYSQLILKPLGDLLERVPYISGLSLLGTGEVALVLNPADLVRAAGTVRSSTIPAVFNEIGEDGHDQVRILVVDDSIATRTLERTLLEAAGFVVETASDGYRAVEALESGRFDLVVSDIQMPNMDGIELTRTIKTRYANLALPVILVTSLGADEDKTRGLEAGADAYIIKKNLTQDELVDTIQQLL